MAPKHHWGSKRNDVSSVPRALPFPWAARRRRHVLEIKSAGRCQWTQHTLFSKSIQKPTPSSDFIPSSSLFCLKHLENTLGTVKQIPEDSFIHSIHFPVLRNTMNSKQMIAGRRTGISSPPWMRNRNARNLMWNAEEHTFSAMESKHSAIKPRPQIHPKAQAETEQRMQTCLQKGLAEHIYRIPPNCYELRWAEGTETFTGFTSAMACGARPNARQRMRVWIHAEWDIKSRNS